MKPLGQALIQGVLIKRRNLDTQRDIHRKYHVRTQQKEKCLQAKEGGLRGTKPVDTLTLDSQPPE